MYLYIIDLYDERSHMSRPCTSEIREPESRNDQSATHTMIKAKMCRGRGTDYVNIIFHLTEPKCFIKIELLDLCVCGKILWKFHSEDSPLLVVGTTDRGQLLYLNSRKAEAEW